MLLFIYSWHIDLKTCEYTIQTNFTKHNNIETFLWLLTYIFRKWFTVRCYYLLTVEILTYSNKSMLGYRWKNLRWNIYAGPTEFVMVCTFTELWSPRASKQNSIFGTHILQNTANFHTKHYKLSQNTKIIKKSQNFTKHDNISQNTTRFHKKLHFKNFTKHYKISQNGWPKDLRHNSIFRKHVMKHCNISKKNINISQKIQDLKKNKTFLKNTTNFHQNISKRQQNFEKHISQITTKFHKRQLFKKHNILQKNSNVSQNNKISQNFKTHFTIHNISQNTENTRIFCEMLLWVTPQVHHSDFLFCVNRLSPSVTF